MHGKDADTADTAIFKPVGTGFVWEIGYPWAPQNLMVYHNHFSHWNVNYSPFSNTSNRCVLFGQLEAVTPLSPRTVAGATTGCDAWLPRFVVVMMMVMMRMMIGIGMRTRRGWCGWWWWRRGGWAPLHLTDSFGLVETTKHTFLRSTTSKLQSWPSCTLLEAYHQSFKRWADWEALRVGMHGPFTHVLPEYSSTSPPEAKFQWSSH